METVNRRFLKCLLLLLVMGTFLHAQHEGESSSYLVKTKEGLAIFQTIVFPPVSNTSYYEIEIEQRAGTRFDPVEQLVTEQNQFEVSLKAGDYRYRVTAYNKMGILEGRSEWQNFTIHPAIQPVADTYQPFYGLYFEMSETTGSITVTGSGFSSESEFALVDHKRKPDWSGKSLENQKGVIFPDQVEVSGDEAVLHFDRKNIKTGNYDVLIRNPGGLWTVLGTVRAGNKNWIDWTFSAGYQPMFAVFDIENSHWEGRTGNQVDRFNPGGYYMRFGFIPLKTKFGNLGLEFNMNFLVSNYYQQDWAKEPGWYSRMFNPLESGTFNLLYQLAVSERWQGNVRFGVGAGETYHKNYSGGDEIFIYFDLGYSVQYFIWKNLYAEAGLNFVYAHNYDLGHGHLMIKPNIGIGWQAGRWAEWAEVAEGAARENDYSVPVKDGPKPEFILSLGWAPMIPLSGTERYGWDNNTWTVSNTEFIQSFNAGGANFRFAWIPYIWRKNKLGFEIEMDILNHKNANLIRDYFPLNEVMFGIRYQRVLNDNWQLNAKAGIGMVPIYAYSYYHEWEYAESGGEFGFNFGASVQYFIWRNLYVEGGLTFILTKTSENLGKNVSNDPRLYMKPNIAIGWQFNRNNETGLRLPGMGFQQAKPKAQQTQQ